MLVDTHCHLHLLERPAEQVVAEALAEGVGHLVDVGVDLASSRQAAANAARLATSRAMGSPSCTSAIGPPSNASGATWPMQDPQVAPEKRPSVTSTTSRPSPTPLIAPVTASISRMPGPPLGPS